MTTNLFNILNKEIKNKQKYGFYLMNCFKVNGYIFPNKIYSFVSCLMVCNN